MELLLLTLIFGLLALAWLVIYIGSRMIRVKKINLLVTFLQKSIPLDDMASQPFLLAKQKSKQLFPNICLTLLEEEKEIHIALVQGKSEPTHYQYEFSELKSVNASNQSIKRGLWPGISSYEEILRLDFADGRSFHWALENVTSNQREGENALFTKEILSSWYKRLNQAISREN